MDEDEYEELLDEQERIIEEQGQNIEIEELEKEQRWTRKEW